MLTRRALIASGLLGTVASGCATSSRLPGLSLAQAIEVLHRGGAAVDIVAQFPTRYALTSYNPGDPTFKYGLNEYPKELWRRLLVGYPANIFDVLPVGSKLISYGFLYGSSLNPTAQPLLICLDKNEQVAGWMYGSAFVGHESETWLDRRSGFEPMPWVLASGDASQPGTTGT